MKRRFGYATAGLLIALMAHGQSGQFDPTFKIGTGFDGPALAVALQLNGRIVVTGDYEHFNEKPRHSLARLNADGSLDENFDPPSVGGPYPDAVIYCVVIDPAEQIVVGGLSFGFFRFLPDGTRDSSFSSPDSKAVWMGIDSSTNLFYSTYRSFWKSHPDGPRDFSFNIGHRYSSDPGVHAAALKTNGNIVLGGGFYYINDQFRARIAEVNQFGQLLTNSFTDGLYGGPTFGGIYTLLAQPDQKVIAGGNFEGSIVRYTADGEIDPDFSTGYVDNGEGWPGVIEAIALQSDGKIIIGGAFVSIGEVPTPNIARLMSDGTLDPSFDPGAGPDNTVRGIQVQPDGRIVVVGNFGSWDGVPAGAIVRLLGDRPVLNTQCSSTGEMILKWPAAYTDYVLQTSSSLTSTNWPAVTNSPAVVSNMCFITNAITSGNQFFRLAKP